MMLLISCAFIVLWFLGLVFSYTLGGLIHLFLVAGVLGALIEMTKPGTDSSTFQSERL